ncbi:hypothetical protein E6C64_07805 [Naasia lichenicola]|uniref:General stress protein n=1 Tax=Naasia lichenicola TaxID=2565933 RepID=A0A4S4FNW5_9MICO|nr:hypothetical protein E6C64_08660 [Naasia lichenicola]THG31938.1 hypothetical protein E6C64_07805 [Naasia lichenicola]
MAGTKMGGVLAARINMERHGKDFYKLIGAKGGRNGAGPDYRKGGPLATGFAAHPDLARIAGAKGGRISKRRKADA